MKQRDEHSKHHPFQLFSNNRLPKRSTCTCPSFATQVVVPAGKPVLFRLYQTTLYQLLAVATRLPVVIAANQWAARARWL